MRQTRYKRVRTVLRNSDLTQENLAEILGISSGAITDRMVGRQPFSVDQAYKFLDHFGIPHAEMHKFFPPGGIEEEPIIWV